MLKGDRCNSTKCAIVKRNYPPGIHGSKGRARQTEYSLQLHEKQKAKKIYNLLEKQFKLTFDKASKQKGDAGENLMKLLERRLDNVIYRMGYAKSRNQARQCVIHGHFTVNGRKVNIPSFIVKTGDIIKIKASSSKKKAFASIEEKLAKNEIPGWINFDKEIAAAKILHEPKKDDLERKINTPMIVEFYSR